MQRCHFYRELPVVDSRGLVVELQIFGDVLVRDESEKKSKIGRIQIWIVYTTRESCVCLTSWFQGGILAPWCLYLRHSCQLRNNQSSRCGTLRIRTARDFIRQFYFSMVNRGQTVRSFNWSRTLDILMPKFPSNWDF